MAQTAQKEKKVLLIGSGFVAAEIFTRLCGFNNIHITVMDRKDPSGLRFIHNDCRRIIDEKYCKDLKYMDVFTGKEFGDKKRNLNISFHFKDWTKEEFTFMEDDYDIIIHAGSIYDSLYAQYNQKDLFDVNAKGIINIMDNIKYYDSKKRPFFIFISSINVYGDQSKYNKEEITEDDTTPNPIDPLNEYLYFEETVIKSKCQFYDIDYLILRLGNLVGHFTPVSSLVNSAVRALLTAEPSFDVYHGNESIEILDIQDFGSVINKIISMYEEDKYDSLKNQIVNLKSEETDPKTVSLIVNSIFGDALALLPKITKEHGINGLNEDFKLKSPKIVNKMMYDHPRVKFNVPISLEKAYEIFKYTSSKPMLFSILPTTVSYLLGYILSEEKVPETKRQIFEKIFAIPVTPRPDSLPAQVNDDVKAMVAQITHMIDEKKPLASTVDDEDEDWEDEVWDDWDGENGNGKPM